MIEIKDLTKIQKRKLIKDDIFEVDVEHVEDIADEYCKDIMGRIETLFGSECKVKYIGCTDRIGNLLVSDAKKSLVSSANLSYHGMQGNVEMGFLIESPEKAKQIEEVIKEMVRMKVFVRV